MAKKILQLGLTLLLAIGPLTVLSAETIVVNPERQDVHLSRNAIRSIFAMRIPQWPDGVPIRVFVLKDTDPLHIEFCKDILGIFPYQLRRIWDRQVFSGTGIEPTVVDSEQEMRERIAETEGAIGYLEERNVDDTVKSLGNHYE